MKTDTRISVPAEKALQKLALEMENGPMDEVIDNAEGWDELVRNVPGWNAREKVAARRFLTWTVCTPAERELLAEYRKKFGTQ